MTLAQIYKNGHTFLAKDGNEGLISMDRFNTFLPSWYHEFIRAKLEEQYAITPEGKVIPKGKFSTKIIDNLVRTIEISGTVDGNDRYFVPTGSTFMYWIGANTTTEYNGQLREIELISDEEFRSRRSNILSKPFSEYPAMCYRIGRLYLYPSDITNVSFSYIKVPATPFLDYYMDANYDTQFLALGETKTMSGGMQYRDGTTSGAKTSQTVELEIPVGMHPAFQQYIIETLQGTLSDLNAEQLSIAKKQMEESR
jgi:hypothetical protein